ncbi:hypothetical protein NAEGRDRAFT_81360 [Naegleria gruberi]|uniref:Uncharacterized protein n=1 Tax=Naegleria gruberi TaxID=5762 RepID=D2VVC7_NAEGR|nr:uncharacterized protein NAEGRDRAFT_81360 [Naegleria gruberi]EFC39287.1 hypothetical protein NAEGRDRAFT_81360 [Naegleria gruberi]|eukprot:XP_002672031.1 hypothetical protein NAEGRDRAFT_81360 [Naegleria gruberi strain NEG-M]
MTIDDPPCLSVALFGLLGEIDYRRGTSSVFAYDRFLINKLQINFAILERLSVPSAFRLCCIADACIIAINSHNNNFEMFQNILLIINNSTSIRNVLVLVHPTIQIYDFENEFDKLIKRNLIFKVVSFAGYSSDDNLSRYLKRVETSNESNELLEWLRSLGPNLNYENLKNQPPLCSSINSFKNYYGTNVLVKIESGYLTHLGTVDINSENPTSLKIERNPSYGYSSFNDAIDWERAYAGQLVPINLQSLKYKTRSSNEMRLLRGALLGNWFDKSKGS